MRRLLLGDYGADACPACDSEIIASSDQSAPDHCPSCASSLRPVVPAQVRRRVLAASLDLAVVCIPLLPLNYWLASWTKPQSYAADASMLVDAIDFFAGDVLANILAYSPTFLAIALYYFLFHSFFGQTLGQRLLSLRLIDAHASQPSLPRVAIRIAAMALIPLSFGLSAIWCALDPRRQAVHDYLSQTMLIQDSAGTQVQKP